MTVLQDASDQPDSETVPPGFLQGRDCIRNGIAQAAASGVSDGSLLAALLAETLLRLINAYGPAHAAGILSRLAHDIDAGLAPNCRSQ